MLGILVAMVTVISIPGGAPAHAQPMDDPGAPTAAGAGEATPAGREAEAEATVTLNRRTVVTFRTALLGDTPAARAVLAHEALAAALAKGGPGVVGLTPAGEAVRFDLDGTLLFFLVPADIPGPRPAAMLEATAQRVQARLEHAIAERREIGDPRRIAIGAGYAALATVIAYLLLRGLLALRRRAESRLDSQLERWRAEHPGKSVAGTYAVQAQSGMRFATAVLHWALVALLADIWFTFVLRQFAFTRPLGERSRDWLLGVFERFGLAAIDAIPGVVTAMLIFMLARIATRAIAVFMQRVERGELQVGWLDADIAVPTRRLGNLVIWLFALAMAYPYLPGSESDAFKGVSVLAGLMLSLGASGVVGQAMSGLSLMYARAVRVGEYVKIGETEGTVTAIGMFATTIHTGTGVEVSLPSASIASQPVHNFSRLVQNGQFMLHTAVTIGYATPWREVHAMLLEAAGRTPGVAREPPPYVVQTALSDFYVEYRLCAQGDRSAPRRRAEAINQLHCNIQDVFNEHGVQIMSPHYIADPASPQLVPPGGRFAGPMPAGDAVRPMPAGDAVRPMPAGDAVRPMPAGDAVRPMPAGDAARPMRDAGARPMYDADAPPMYDDTVRPTRDAGPRPARPDAPSPGP